MARTKMTGLDCFQLLVAGSVAFFSTLLLPSSWALTVSLNEVMASNNDMAEDEDGEFPDWIELYNWGDEAVSLEGYGLSDDYEDPFRWTLPPVFLEPNAFLIIWASGKDRRQPGEELHASFSISASGEEVLLTSPGGQRMDELSPRPIPTGLSVGRQPDGIGSWFYFTTPTPGGANTSSGYERLLQAPVFSHAGGFHGEDFDLAIESPDADVQIYYTLDGSKPDPANLNGSTYRFKNDYPHGPLFEESYRTFAYTGPLWVGSRAGEANRISEVASAFNGFFRPGTEWEEPDGEVFKTTVVRAIAVASGALPSPVATRTYLIGADDRYTLPVISLATTEGDLFDYDRGIYVPGVVFNDWRLSNPTRDVNGSTPANYLRSGRQWELPAHIEFYEPDGSLGFAQNVGIRVHGGWSRANRQKALRIFARSEYDNESSMEHPVYPGHEKQGRGGPLKSFKRLILHTSGQDNGLTMFRDAMAQSLIAHTGIDTQAYRPAIVFLNGEYWGIHNIRERYDHHYVATNYDLAAENVVILFGNAMIVAGESGDQQPYQNLVQFAQSHATAGTLDDPAVYAQIAAQMDVENFIHHYAAQIYYANIDWPTGNLRWWRSKGEVDPERYGHDGKWRWMLYDTDHGFGLFVTPNWGGWNIDATHNTVAHATSSSSPLIWSNPLWATQLFRSLLASTTFRHQFLNTFSDHLNSSFHPQRVVQRINEMQMVLAPNYPEHARRWNQPATFWSGGDTWDGKVQVMRDFANERVPYVRQHLNQQFNLNGTASLTVDVNPPAGGKAQVNSLTIAPGSVGMSPTPYPWTGTYFRNVPVTLTAKADPGYTFQAWQDADGEIFSETEKISVSIENGVTLVALFEAEPPPPCFPEPHVLALGPYHFSTWSEAAVPGTYPSHMVFQQTAMLDPGLEDEMDSDWVLPYNLVSRSRFFGLGAGGIGFINTGNAQEDLRAGFLGAVLLALDTRGENNIRVTWTGGTVLPNSRVYNLRLQYRIGAAGPFQNLLDASGEPVEYQRNPSPGHAEEIGPIHLPEKLEGQACVQLRWKYYFTGERINVDSGQRSFLRIGEIRVQSGVNLLSGFAAWQETVFPDPADLEDSRISGSLAETQGDGVPNIIRYALALPVGEPVREHLPAPELDGEGLSIAFHRNPENTDLAYLVEASSDLKTWSEVLYDSRLDLTPNNEGERMRIRDFSSDTFTSRFLRLRFLLLD